jgi:hypothetical protein
MMPRRPRRAALGAVVVVFSGCVAAPPPRPWRHPSAAELATAAARLERLRAAEGAAPYVESIATTLRDPRSGRVVDGRGAIAVAPGQAVRMILVGGAGATLLDAWVTRSRWRIAVPPLQIVRRGGADDPPELPVGFLRWWFIAGLEGTLFASSPDGTLLLLRDRDAVVELRLDASSCSAARQRRISATRRLQGRTERVDQCRSAERPAAGDEVQYADVTRGLQVGVRVESVGAAPPDGEAFRDPDSEPPL